jgi:hypothetical protein
MRHLLVFSFFISFALSLNAQGNRQPRIMREFNTDTAMLVSMPLNLRLSSSSMVGHIYRDFQIMMPCT